MAYQEAKDSIDVYENDIEYWLADFCEKNNIEDLRKESQNLWNAALLYLYKYMFKGTNKLKLGNVYTGNLMYNSPSNNNAYDIDKVNEICDIYINLCYVYEKEVSIMGFCKLTGIDDNTIYDWRDNRRGLSTTGSEIHKKLNKEREESLSNIALSGKRNPVGVIAVLNNKCGWSENRQVIKEERITVAPMSREQMLAELGENLSLIDKKDG